MKAIFYLFFTLTIISCQTNRKLKSNSKTGLNEIFQEKVEHKLISSGDNFPDFDYTKDSMDFFLLSLHKNIPQDDFMKKTGFSIKKITQIENILKSKNWLHNYNKNVKPSVFIATKDDGKMLFQFAQPIVNKIVFSIESELPLIKKLFNQTKISQTTNFEKWSFFILSNVLLDNCQINNVENEFLKINQRPFRNGRNYYFSILVNAEKNKESFGIYGNQYIEYEGKTICVYGNNRTEIKIDSIENHISSSDNTILIKISENFKPKILNILNSNKAYIREVYSKTGYKKEISFDEFFIWWYHFIYTKATDVMNEKGLLKIPISGNFNYSIEE